jgi:hypothetical protein
MVVGWKKSLIEKLAAKRKKLVVVVLAINEEIGLQG